MTHTKKARALGFNHVALEVGDIDAALEFYGRFLDFELQSKSATMAFIGLGDQFINFSKGRRQTPDDERHFGLVPDVFQFCHRLTGSSIRCAASV